MTEVQADLLDSLEAGPMTAGDLVDDTGRDLAVVEAELGKMRRSGWVTEAGHIAKGGPVLWRRSEAGRKRLDRKPAPAVVEEPAPVERLAGNPSESPRADLVFETLRLHPDGVAIADLSRELGLKPGLVSSGLATLKTQGRARWNGQRSTFSRWFPIVAEASEVESESAEPTPEPVAADQSPSAPEAEPAPIAAPAPITPPGVKADLDKPRWDLLPFVATAVVVDVLTYGARKYSPDNWRHVPDARRRYFAAAMRHLVAWFAGERVDPESGRPHLAHATCCLLFLLELDEIDATTTPARRP
jgi:hypothetical protein